MRLLAALAIAIAVVAMPACGSSGLPTVTVEAIGLRFAPDTITFDVGASARIRLRNRDDVEHDLFVDGIDASLLTDDGRRDTSTDTGLSIVQVHVAAGETAAVAFVPNLTGVYLFYCTIPGHREAGMTGTLTVR